MYEDRAQNYDPAIYEVYLIHDTPIFLPHHLQPCADYSIAISLNTTNLYWKATISAVTVSLKS